METSLFGSICQRIVGIKYLICPLAGRLVRNITAGFIKVCANDIITFPHFICKELSHRIRAFPSGYMCIMACHKNPVMAGLRFLCGDPVYVLG